MLRSLWDTVDELASHRADLAALLAAGHSLDGWARSVADSLAGPLFRTNLVTQLAGALFVLDVEQAQRVSLDAHPRSTFLDLPFAEAIAHFQSRQLMTPEEFDDLTDAERFRAFTMSRVASERIRERAQQLIAEAMQPGGIGRDAFIAQIQADEVALGMSPQHHGYLENVYRTATATSYGAGRYRAQTLDGVKAITGFWEYLTAGDNRVRPQHEALADSVWSMDDPMAKTIYPPNGFMCRCVMIAVSEDDFEPHQMMIGRTDTTAAVTEGFRASPGEAIDDEASASTP